MCNLSLFFKIYQTCFTLYSFAFISTILWTLKFFIFLKTFLINFKFYITFKGSFPYLNYSTIFMTYSSVKSSYTHSPLTYIIGAFEHAPRHSTYYIVNSPSLVVSESWIPKCFSRTFFINIYYILIYFISN